MRSFFFLSIALLATFSLPLNAAENSSDTEISLCHEHIRNQHGGDSIDDKFAAMEKELQTAQRLFEEALSMRAQAIELYNELHAKNAKGEPLSGLDLQRLNSGATALLAQREALLNLAFAHECWVASTPPENQREAGIQATGIMTSLAAALILYDNYLSAISLYRNDNALRQHLNRPDSGFALHAGQLNKSAAMFASSVNRQRIRRAINWYEQTGRRENSEFEGYPYLVQLIAQSPSYQMVRQVNPIRVFGDHFELFSLFTIDSLFGLKNESSNLTSLLFGNTLGLVATRHGKLYGQMAVTEKLGKTLQAGDILLEKTPFRLTDSFIPGHWGHAAIWVGSEGQLRDLGIWDNPVVKPHQENIRQGRGIVEALRSGVTMNNVEHFLNIDDIAVLRHPSLLPEKRAEVILQTLRQVGKAYDFNFDAETTHRIFCSKLVYLAYGDLQWPTSRILGRSTVSPDNIGARALGDGPLSIALLYHDGQEVTETAKSVMEKLMQPARVKLTRQETD